MKNVIVTNIDNENVEITSSDWSTFCDIVMFDNNREKFEIFNGKHWVKPMQEIDEIEGRKVDEYGEDFQEILENYFTNHLFASEFHGA
jgi:hypothetical protein